MNKSKNNKKQSLTLLIAIVCLLFFERQANAVQIKPEKDNLNTLGFQFS